MLDDLRYTEHESANQANIPTEIDGWPSLFLVWGGFFLSPVQLINLAIKRRRRKKKKPPNSRQLETVKTFVSARVMGWNLLEICTQLMALNLYIPFGAFFDGL